MIIRRKPIGFDGLRKPRSLGMSLLRDSIQRMHNHTVQRVSPSDEPLSAEVSDFASDDFDYGDNAAFDGGDAAEFADYGDSADDGGLDAAIRRAEAPTPGQPDRAVRRTPRSTTNAKNTGNRPVQRSAQPQKPTAKPSQQPKQPAPPASQSVQRTPASPEPASSGAFKRQQLDQGDTMPRDLSSIMNLHRERAGGNVAAGENPPPASVDNLPPIPSFLADRAIKKAEAPVQRSTSAPVQRSTTPGSAITPVQRTPAPSEPASFDADEPPRPRRRAQIIDVTPPKKGLPFGLDELPDTGEAAAAPLGTSPLGQPVQRDYAPATDTPAAPAANNDDFFAALERAADVPDTDDVSAPEPENASANFDQSGDTGQTMLDMDVRSLRAAPTTGTADVAVQREMDDDAAVYEDQPQSDAYQDALQAAIRRAEAPTQDHDDSPDNPADDFDSGDDDGGGGGGSGGSGGGAPRNTPSPSPGSVQPTRATDSKPKNTVQPTRATCDTARPSANPVQPTRNNQPQQSINTPEPTRGANNTTIQRDFNQDSIDNFDQDGDAPAASFPTGYDSADDYQAAISTAISAAEASAPVSETPAPSPVRRTMRNNVQRAPEPVADEDEDTPIAQRTVQRAAEDDLEDAPIAQRMVQRDAHPAPDDEDTPIAQRTVQRAAEDDLDIGIEEDEDAGVQRTFAANNATVQRDFDADGGAAEDTPVASFPTGYDSADDYQSAINAAISAAESPTSVSESPAAPSPVRRTTQNNVQRDAAPALDEEETDPTAQWAQRSVQRTTRGNVQRAPEDDLDMEGGASDSTVDLPMAAPEDEEAGVQRTFDARSGNNAPVQRDFAGDEPADPSSDYFPAGYDNADSYQSAISAAIQRAEGPTPADMPDTPATPSRRTAQGKTAQGNATQRSTAKTVQRTPDTSATNRPARPARPSAIDTARTDSGDRGVFKTGAIMDAPPSLEDDAHAVWTGQPYAGAVQRDYDDAGGDELQDEIEIDGDGFGDVQRTPDWNAAEFNDSAAFDDSDDAPGMASSVESELLQMIGLAPDTPIARPNVQRSPKDANSADTNDGSNDGSDSATLNGLIQRSVGATRVLDAQRAVAETNTDQSTDDQISPEKSEQIEKVAQAVYTRLRDRLKVERERLRGRRS
jgi:hypothetical protein